MKYILNDNLTLNSALKLYFPDSSGRTLQNWIKWGRVLIDGIPSLKGHSLIKKGQTLSLKDKPLQRVQGIPILYQDRWMVVIEKPAGLLSVPADKNEPNVMHLLKLGLKTPSIFPVHRLDQETSGILVYARSKIAEEKFDPLFENHDLDREYIAIIEGHIPGKEGTWECYIREKENFDMEVTTEELGKRAVTHYEVVRRSKKFSYLRLKLETGRKHQIRVHASQAGYPILGDKRYGSIINPFKRLCLHAYRLSFVHPFTHKQMTFVSQAKPNKPFPFKV